MAYVKKADKTNGTEVKEEVVETPVAETTENKAE